MDKLKPEIGNQQPFQVKVTCLGLNSLLKTKDLFKPREGCGSQHQCG